MKTCSQCGQTKSLTEFYKNLDRKDGLRDECKTCKKKYTQRPDIKLAIKKYQSKPEIQLAQKQYEQIPKRKFNVYKRNAKKRGYSFDLTFNQFTELINQPCKYCGHDGPNGVDRIDNNQGYTLENSTACCGICNQLKSTRSTKQFYAHILKIIKHSFKNWRFARK